MAFALSAGQAVVKTVVSARAPRAAQVGAVAPAKIAGVCRPLRLQAARRSVVVHSAATDEIVEKLKTLTLLEAAELVKQIEATFGVDASAPAGGGMMMMAGPAAAAEAEEAQTEFTLIINDCAADKRIAAIKVVRALTSLGLKEAKDAVTAVPFTILEAKPKAEVDKAKAELEAAGCKCEIK